MPAKTIHRNPRATSITLCEEQERQLKALNAVLEGVPVSAWVRAGLARLAREAAKYPGEVRAEARKASGWRLPGA